MSSGGIAPLPKSSVSSVRASSPEGQKEPSNGKGEIQQEAG